ncbi:MAG TPA: ABC transporter ATP-binding protein [Gaiellaceae bacterium]|jgi:ABC-2 type transport system ATP-binding protein
MSFGLFDVSVRFGSTTALDNITFAVPPGSVSAVVGGDGAGKTTLLGCLTGSVQPSSGRVERPAKSMLGVMPSTSGTWRDLTVEENIDFVARAYGITGDRLRQKQTQLLARAGLDRARDRLAGQLSGGMRQKLGFLLALLHDPTLLVLDEPTTGVDPVSRVELWGMISEAAADGSAVAMATTYLDEAERASTVLVLDAGQALASGTADDVIRSLPGTITIVEHPTNPRRAWRRGRVYHEWHPAGDASSKPVEEGADLEDTVIAQMLYRREQLSGASA